MERILYDHEHEHSKLRLTDFSDWIFSRQKFYRRYEHVIECTHWFLNVVWVVLAVTGGVHMCLNNSYLTFKIWSFVYIYLLIDLVLTFGSLYCKMNKYHNFEFQRTKRSMILQFSFMLLATLGHCAFLI